ncbi:prephenate dehydrogenase [Streptomyces actinomycinicus]|uniref:Prephenate dehydrogenase n=1 Tax=Streptomyces actinomycinicus TaxID=1695166 RepID=A0A937EN09_9ACTN|nr:prephenate dehydrogenase [Streptomyces actinomycinicus]
MRALAVVGTGLIGTSVGLAMSRHGVAVHLVDRDPAAARTAAALGAGVAGPPAGPVDLAVLAVPPRAVAGVLAEQRARGLARSYTDVASVKALPLREAGEGGLDASFVGGHPMAGRERSGPLAARADLFEDRPWVLTPAAGTSRTALNHALELVARCGATPLVMDGEAHDRAVALTSHAPHVMASLLAARLQDGKPDALRLAGQGLRDTARVAGGDPRLWAEILCSNAAPVVQVLREVEKDLAGLRAALEDLARDGGPRPASRHQVAELLERGAAGLRAIGPAPAHRPFTQGPFRVTLAGRPGELARLLDTLGEHGVGAHEVTTRATPGQDGVTVEFPAPAGGAEELRRRMAERGWHAEDGSARPRRDPLPQPSPAGRRRDEDVVPAQRVASLPGG